MCCSRLAANTGRKRVAKNRHLGTIAQLCRAISSQLRHISTIGKKLVKQQYLLYMSPENRELRPTRGWDRFVSLGHPSKLQRVSRLGSVTARHSMGVSQTAALNRGRHLYSAVRPSRWALAHISSCCLWWPYVIGQTIIFLPCNFFLSIFYLSIFFMVALWNRAGHYIFALWLLLLSFFIPRLISAVAHWMSAILPHMVWP